MAGVIAMQTRSGKTTSETNSQPNSRPSDTPRLEERVPNLRRTKRPMQVGQLAWTLRLHRSTLFEGSIDTWKRLFNNPSEPLGFWRRATMDPLLFAADGPRADTSVESSGMELPTTRIGKDDTIVQLGVSRHDEGWKPGIQMVPCRADRTAAKPNRRIRFLFEWGL